ncbi:restriction endonuclease [Curtobacterium sp. MCPF17_021]|uniref:nSTAND3 domain-containing NTPase n=1 Tax=Curtobacterium sp. MCPF17_021 TaxID=2175639 RepID=UPI0015E88C4A|nr:restriction endonuclease [Curtobacterium sp. MCPF17_021]WIE82773.1 restriction endonuclease [Curtobacterium sp. MCPF17_021]
MTEYTFQELSPHDFERLVADLMAKRWGQPTETFPAGKDGGIDVRLLSAGGNRYVQCKHSPGKLHGDISAALEKEAAKISGKDLREYWLATSAKITNEAKAKIAITFAKQKLTPEHILGVNDLNAAIRNAPKIEQAHTKLYLSSLVVLNRILNNADVSKQRIKFQEILDDRSLFVEHHAYAAIRKMLDEKHAVIISGAPGVGKSTVANMIGVRFLDEEWEVWLVDSAETIYRNHREDAKQLFIYDDFLGQTSLTEKLGRNEDSELSRLIANFKKSDNHRLILTTREYIFAQATQTYSRLSSRQFDHSKFMVEVKSYSLFERALILYNHIHYSSLPNEARLRVAESRVHLRILNHQNYNPRMLRMLVEGAETSRVGSNIDQYIINGLDKPHELWQEVIEVHLSGFARDLLEIMATLPPEISDDDLFDAAMRYEPYKSSSIDPHNFHRSIDVLEKVFVKSRSGGARLHLSLTNPTVRDFLAERIVANPQGFRRHLQATQSVSGINAMLGWMDSRDLVGALSWDEMSSNQRAGAFEAVKSSVDHLLDVIQASCSSYVPSPHRVLGFVPTGPLGTLNLLINVALQESALSATVAEATTARIDVLVPDSKANVREVIGIFKRAASLLTHDQKTTWATTVLGEVGSSKEPEFSKAFARFEVAALLGEAVIERQEVVDRLGALLSGAVSSGDPDDGWEAINAAEQTKQRIEMPEEMSEMYDQLMEMHWEPDYDDDDYEGGAEAPFDGGADEVGSLFASL